ncbi:MAG: thioredoxin family protein [Verrucomicrobia bacterium]|nr:thioredoxin family protein [Verrucomicrobiota bacterium]
MKKSTPHGLQRIAGIVCVSLGFLCVAISAGAKDGIDPMAAPDWLPPLRPPTDGEPTPPLPEVVPGLVILPEKEVTPEEMVPEDVDAAPGEEPAIADWHTNPRKARDLAKESGKFHIMALLGVNWTTSPNPSRMLATEILNTPSFPKKIGNDFVLSYVDFPQNKNEWSGTHKKLKEYYGVKGFPALIFFDSKGKQFGKISGYKAMSEETERMFLFNVEFDQIIKTQRDAERRNAERRVALVEEGYRDWESAKGSTLFAKLMKANETIAMFKDEDRQIRKVQLEQLDLAGRALIQRMVKAKHVPDLASM